LFCPRAVLRYSYFLLIFSIIFFVISVWSRSVH